MVYYQVDDIAEVQKCKDAEGRWVYNMAIIIQAKIN